MKFTIICVRDGNDSESFTGTIDDFCTIFKNTLSHGFNVQKEYNMRKIPKKIPTNIVKFVSYLNDCTYNVTKGTEKFFKLAQ